MSEIEILQQIDRLVSASTPSDALSSLSSLTASLQPTNIDPTNANANDESPEDTNNRILKAQRILAESQEFMTVLCSLLSESSIQTMNVDGGDSAACQFLSAVLSSLDDDKASASGKKSSGNFKFQSNAQLKKFLSGGKLSHALLDLLSHGTGTDSTTSTHTSSLYAKTQAIQLLSRLTTNQPTLLHSQILSAPDGLHRIIDLLTSEESIRNEALLLCTTMARTNTASARLMIFGETYEKVFDIAQGDEHVAGDCLRLCIEMTKQDEMGSEVFLGSNRLVRDLEKFLDLRLGKQFVNPQEELHGEGDDLDDILNAGSGKDSKNDKKGKVPFLTKEEGEVMLLALELLRVLSVGDEDGGVGGNDAKKQARQKSMLAHDTLSRLLIDMALYTLPPPDSPASVYVSAAPTLDVQRRALDVMAALALGCGEESQQLILSKRGIYLNAGVLDRLMYLICTGDGSNRGSETDGGADQISMHSLGVLRCLLSAEEASMMMMHTLAPPPPEDDNAMSMPMEAPVVQKLVNTLGENLHVLLNPDISKDLKEDDRKRIRRMIIGAAGALGIFLTNGAGETTREMLLRVPVPQPPPTGEPDERAGSDSPPSLVGCMMAYLDLFTNDKSIVSESSDVVAALLRLFIEWVPSTPNVISELLSSASSVSLGVLLQQKYKKIDPPTVQSMSAVLLGLCMDNMKPEDEMGGWSISSIMNLIKVGLGIGKFTQLLESLKDFMANVDGKAVGPWTCCSVERSHLLQWYKESVNVVRKRAIQELTLSNGTADDSDAEDVSDSHVSSSRDTKAMKKLVSQQTAEIEVLRSKLSETQETLSAQSFETKALKKRLESNPSQLDDTMNEYTSKISELEVQNRALSSTIVLKDNDFKEAMHQKGTVASQQQQQLDQARDEIRNLLSDKATTKEELKGLATAYTNLEGEYNRVASQNGSSGQANGDDTSEGVMPMSSYQIMKDENAKLKKDIRAANDWMKMAVKKMDAMSTRNVALESEVKSAQAMSVDQAKLTTSETNHMQESLSAADHHLKELESDRDQLRSEVQSLKDGLAAAEQTIQHLSEDMETTAENVKLCAQIKEMKDEIENDSKQYAASVAGLEQSLASKDEVIAGLEKQIGEAEAKISESQILQVDSVETKTLQDEVKKLSAANKAAQDWMATAVKHHSSLKKQVEELKRKNIELSSEREEQGASSADTTAFQRQIADLLRERDYARNQMIELEARLIEVQSSEEKNMAETTKELVGLNAQLIERQQEVQTISEKLSTSESNFNGERQQLLDEQAKLECSLKDREAEFQVLKKELTDVEYESKLSGSEQNAAVAQMQQEIQILKDENENLISQREEHVAAIEDMRNRLTEFHSWTETAQQRIGELVSEKEAAETRIQELEHSASTHQPTESPDSIECEKLRAEVSSSQERISELEAETQATTARIQELELEKNQFEEALSELQQSKDEYKITKDIADAQESELNRLWSEVSAARKRISELESENDAYEGKIQTMWENDQSAKDQCEDLQLELQHSKDEVDAMQEIANTDESELEILKSQVSAAQQQIAELEAEKDVSQAIITELAENEQSTRGQYEQARIEFQKSKDEFAALKEAEIAKGNESERLRSEVSNLEMQLGDLDGRNRALSEDNKALEQTNADLLGKSELLDDVEENLFEKENEVTELQTALAAARQELTDLQEESDNAITQWKGELNSSPFLINSSANVTTILMFRFDSHHRENRGVRS